MLPEDKVLAKRAMEKKVTVQELSFILLGFWHRIDTAYTQVNTAKQVMKIYWLMEVALSLGAQSLFLRDYF